MRNYSSLRKGPCCFSSWNFCLTRWGPVRVSGAVDPGRPQQRLALRCGCPAAVQHHQRRGVVLRGPATTPLLVFQAAAPGGDGGRSASSVAAAALFGTRQRGGGGGGRIAVSATVGVLRRRPGKARPADRRVDALPAARAVPPLPRAQAMLLLAAEVRPQNVVDEKVGGSVRLLGDLQRQDGRRG